MAAAKPHRLERKLVWSVLWVAAVFAAVTSSVLFVTELKRSTEKTAAMLEQLLDTVESTAAIAAYTGNRQIGEDVLKGLLRNEIVHEATLSNGRGLDLHNARDTEVRKQGEVIRTLFSPFGDGEVIGEIAVFPEASFNLQEARHSALGNAFNSTLLIGLTALMVLALVRSSLSKPLMQVSSALHAIKAGAKQRLEPLPRNREDELGRLVKDINGLLDVLEQKFAAERALRQEIQAVEQQLRSLFVTTSAGIFVLDSQGRLLTANPSLDRVLGIQQVAPEARSAQDFASLAFAEPERVRELMSQAEQRGQAVALDLRLKNHLQGEGAWVHCLISRQTDAAGAAHYEGVVYDVTERLEAEARTQHAADHDPLTGLARRHVAERQLQNLLNDFSTAEPIQVLMVLDLDNFKQINDTHGHQAGDAVLVETGRRLKACVRAGDIVARHGGDEFIIVLVNCIPPDIALRIARDIVTAVSTPIALSAQLAVRVGISIGMAVQADRRQSVDELFQRADRAMYEVKRRGKNGFGVSEEDGSIRVESLEGPAEPEV